MTRVPAMRTLENALRRAGFVYVAGVDEVGRGCLAGPVVAAAVVLHPDRHIPGVCDSKLVPAAERERLCERILRHAIAWAVAQADPVVAAEDGQRPSGHARPEVESRDQNAGLEAPRK